MQVAYWHILNWFFILQPRSKLETPNLLGRWDCQISHPDSNAVLVCQYLGCGIRNVELLLKNIVFITFHLLRVHLN